MRISGNPRVLSLDIEVLNDAGYEIMEMQVGREKMYYVEDRAFSVPELKVMIDALEAASFISEKKTEQIVDKIASLGGMHRADLLKRNMVCFNTRKHTNEHILFSIDSLEEAIIRKKKVAFHYFDLNEKGEREYRLKDTGEKKCYYVEPIAPVFNEDNYYLMTYSSRHPDATANYRVDRMEHVEVVEDSVLSDAVQAKIEGVGKYTEQVGYDAERFKVEIIKHTADYCDFANALHFDIVVGFDLGGKYTEKDGEGQNTVLNDFLSRIDPVEINNLLLEETAKYISDHPDYYPCVMATVHGNTPREYRENVELILNLEATHGVRF